MRSVRDEVERCLPFFIRLCVDRVLTEGLPLDESAVTVARGFYRRFPADAEASLRLHYEETLADLIDLVSTLATRLTPQMIQDFAAKTSADQVCATIERSLVGALRAAG